MIEQTQLPLSAPRARRTDPQTSYDAARRAPRGAPAAILAAFARTPRAQGLTDDEMVRAVSCEHGDYFCAETLKTARSRLSGEGLLEDSGERRLSNRRRESIVWKLA